MRALAGYLSAMSIGLNRLALWGAVLAIVVMAGAVGFQVIARYAFSAPPAWTEEVARYAMIWAGLLGGTVAFHGQIDPTLFPAMRQRRGRQGLGLALVRAVGILIFAFPVLYFSVFGPNQNPLRGFIMRSLDKSAEVTGIPMVFVTAVVPLAIALIVVHVLADIARRVAEVSRAEPQGR